MYIYIYILIYETFYFGLKFIAAPKPSNEIFIWQVEVAMLFITLELHLFSIALLVFTYMRRNKGHKLWKNDC